MQPHHFIHLLDAHNISESSSKEESVHRASTLSPEEIEQAILSEWVRLQEVPSYVEERIHANRGLIEGIATQS